MLTLIPGFWLGNATYLDKSSLWLFLCLALQFLISLKVANDTILPIISVIIINFLIFVFPRSLEYLYIPKLVDFPLMQHVDNKVFNRGLKYFIIGNALLLFGIHAGGAVLKCTVRPAPQKNLATYQNAHKDILGLTLIFILSLGLQILCQCLQGISVIGESSKTPYHLLVQTLCLLFSIDTVLICLVAACVISWEILNKKDYACLLGVLFLYMVTTMYFGSRVGLLRIFFAAVAAFLVAQGNKKIFLSKRKICAIAALSGLAGCMAIICYTTATNYRINLGLRSLESRVDQNGISNRIQQMKNNKDSLSKPVYVLSSILNRLGTLDFAVLTSSLNRSDLPTSIYGSLSYTVKSIANCVPGTPFPEADLNTSQVHDIMYSGRRPEDVKKGGYFSRPWTIWGLGTLFTDGWWAYSAFMGFAGFFIYIMYWLIEKIKSHYMDYIQVLFLCVILPLIYFSMGADHSIIVGVGFISQTLLIIFLLEMAKKIRKYIFSSHQY